MVHFNFLNLYCNGNSVPKAVTLTKRESHGLTLLQTSGVKKIERHYLIKKCPFTNIYFGNFNFSHCGVALWHWFGTVVKESLKCGTLALGLMALQLWRCGETEISQHATRSQAIGILDSSCLSFYYIIILLYCSASCSVHHRLFIVSCSVFKSCLYRHGIVHHDVRQ